MKKSIQRKTGARGLRAIMENVMMDYMYHVPSDKSIHQVVVTKQMVDDNLLLEEKNRRRRWLWNRRTILQRRKLPFSPEQSRREGGFFPRKGGKLWRSRGFSLRRVCGVTSTLPENQLPEWLLPGNPMGNPPDQRADEPQVPGATSGQPGRPRPSILQPERPDLSGGSAGLRLREDRQKERSSGAR